MPKKGETKKKADMRAITKVLTHINEQTFGADAGAAMLEVIDTPGYGGDFMLAGKQERAACLLLGARVFSDPVVNVTTLGAASWLNTQVLQGDQTGITALVGMKDNDLLMQGKLETHATANPFWPMELDSIMPEPLIITPKFTIIHRAANVANYNSKPFYTILTYQIVAVATTKYADMLLTQQRVS